MTLFNDLCKYAIAWEDAEREYWVRACQTASTLASGFGEYINAPGAYTVSDGRRTVPYVKVVRHKIDGERNIPEDTDTISDALQYDADNFLRFSISTALERGHNTYPKRRYGVFLRFKIVNQNLLTIQLLNKTYINFDIDFDRPKTLVKLFDAILDLLKSSFEWRPDGERQSSSIGFEISPERYRATDE